MAKKYLYILTDDNLLKFTYIKDQDKYFEFIKKYFEENSNSKYLEIRLVEKKG